MVARVTARDRQVGDLLDRRLVVVMGKGGVGRTTVAAALGLVAARRGRRAIVCEVGGKARLPELGTGLDTRSIAPEDAKLEWLERQLRSRRLARMLGHSRVFELLTAAAPGLAELVTIGKVWDLAKLDPKTPTGNHDLVILDAPATGQGLALLEAPSTYMRVARVGPIHDQAGRIADFLHDPDRTAVLGVALPEEMPVNETLELESRLRDGRVRLDGVIVNGVYPARFEADEAERLSALHGRVSAGLRAGLGTALGEHKRARAQRAELRRLRRHAEVRVGTLPFLFERDLGLAQLERLRCRLEEWL
jgi:anion-transporting  ArsA/GET3 family ATPase